MKIRWFVILLILLASLSLLNPQAGSTESTNNPVDQSLPPASLSLPPFTALIAGAGHTCAIAINGEVKCWGFNDYGQLGDGTTIERFEPVDVTGIGSGVSAISAGSGHTCALTTGGGVKCWGDNQFGQLGGGTTTPRLMPVDVTGMESGVTTLVAGGGQTCALTTIGGVKCWGSNASGELGDGSTVNRSTPVDVIGLSSGISALATGGSHTCALTSSGGVKCWGNNQYGQLGDGTTANSSFPKDVVGLSSGVTFLAAGGSHTCALTTGGVAKCWGNNEFGQLGNATTTNTSTWVAVIGLSRGVTALAAGGEHTCAVFTSGSVKCWGYNGSGQLGDGTRINKSLPVEVIGLASGVTALEAGGGHTCALTTSGGVKCWGSNDFGALGDGSKIKHNMPMDVGLMSGITALSVGYGHTCALTNTGGVKCWGYNEFGQLGDGTNTNVSTPVDVIGLDSGITALAAGGSHTCALTISGGVKCWGSNEYGQLGDGRNTYPATGTPVDVVGMAGGVTALVAGGDHTCALTNTGEVKCWGSNEFGELGDGTCLDKFMPVNVIGLGSGVTSLAAGGGHTCALTTSGGVRCWGSNWFGQLGVEINAYYSSTPVDVDGLASGVTALEAGGGHACALTTSDRVKCWGLNIYGQLGDRTTTDRHTPVEVIGLVSDVTALAVGGLHTCALTTSGGVKCWGYNEYGQLGDGSYAVRVEPVGVIGLESGVSVLAAGGNQSCVLVAGGQPKCWGDYGYIPRLSLVPVDVVGISPQLFANHGFGRPGSTITVTGLDFPPNSELSLSANGAILSNTLQTNDTGGFIVFIDTDGADVGLYLVTNSTSPDAAVSFTLYGAAPLLPWQGGGHTLALPAGIAYPLNYIILPVINLSPPTW